MNRLAADDDELVYSDGVSGGAGDVVEVFAARLPDLRGDLAAIGLGERAGKRRRLPEITHLRSVTPMAQFRSVHAKPQVCVVIAFS